jgi:hypothetical protein
VPTGLPSASSGHVGDGADERSGLGGARIGIGGETEVAELGEAAGGEPDVRRLDVTVKHAARVSVRQRLTDLPGDPQRVARQAARASCFDQFFERAARHVLADDVGPALLVAEVEDRDDARMVRQRGHRPRLDRQPREIQVVAALGLENAHRNLTAERQVARQIYALVRIGSAADAEPIPRALRRPAEQEPRERCVHCGGFALPLVGGFTLSLAPAVAFVEGAPVALPPVNASVA